MRIVNTISRIVGGTETEQEEEEPTHICPTCGKEYYAASREIEISSCHGCGGARVEPT